MTEQLRLSKLLFVEIQFSIMEIGHETENFNYLVDNKRFALS